MRLAQDLSGKQIITLDEGRIIGQVKDLYLNGSLTRLAGIHLGKEGLIRKKSRLISTDSVRVFGMDVMLIDDEEAVKDSKSFTEADDWVRMSKVIGREIDTPGGTRIGTIADIAFDGAGSIIAFTLHKVFVDGPISENRYIPADCVIDNGNKDGNMTIDLALAEGKEATESEPPAKIVIEDTILDDTVDEIEQINLPVDSDSAESL